MNFQVDSEKMSKAVSMCNSCASHSGEVFEQASSLASLPVPSGFTGSDLLSSIKSSASELKEILSAYKGNCKSLYDMAVSAEKVGNVDELSLQLDEVDSKMDALAKKYGLTVSNGVVLAEDPLDSEAAKAVMEYKTLMDRKSALNTEIADAQRAYRASANNSQVNFTNKDTNKDTFDFSGSYSKISENNSIIKKSNETIANIEKEYGKNWELAGLGVPITAMQNKNAALNAKEKAEKENKELYSEMTAYRDDRRAKKRTTDSKIKNNGGVNLSGISQGYSSSKNDEKVNLNTQYGENVVFDKSNTVNGEEYWYFKQKNGTGYAWFKADDVRDYVDKK